MSWLVAQRYSFDLSSGRPGFNPQTCSNYFFYIFQFFSMSFSLLCYFDYSNIDVRNTTKEFVSNFTNDWNIGHLSLKLWAVVSPKGLDNYFRNIPIWTRYDPTINLAYDPSLCYKVFCGYNSNKMWAFNAQAAGKKRCFIVLFILVYFYVPPSYFLRGTIFLVLEYCWFSGFFYPPFKIPHKSWLQSLEKGGKSLRLELLLLRLSYPM